jgi:hypothetical protein
MAIENGNDNVMEDFDGGGDGGTLSGFFIEKGKLPTWHDAYVANSTDKLNMENVWATAWNANDGIALFDQTQLLAPATDGDLAVIDYRNRLAAYKYKAEERLIYKGCGNYLESELIYISTGLGWGTGPGAQPYYKLYRSGGKIVYEKCANSRFENVTTVTTDYTSYNVLFEIVGGGGGGAGGKSGKTETRDGAGGGGGAYACGILDFTKCKYFVIYIGRGGSAGSNGGGNGGNGGASTIKAFQSDLKYETLSVGGGGGATGATDSTESSAGLGGRVNNVKFTALAGNTISNPSGGQGTGSITVFRCGPGADGGKRGTVGGSLTAIEIEFSKNRKFKIPTTSNGTAFNPQGGQLYETGEGGGGGASQLGNGLDYVGDTTNSAFDVSYGNAGGGGAGGNGYVLGSDAGSAGQAGECKIWAFIK